MRQMQADNMQMQRDVTETTHNKYIFFLAW